MDYNIGQMSPVVVRIAKIGAMDEKLKQLAEKYGFSVEAVTVLWRALQVGGGKMAQFTHPELGGTGQWMPGMVMIGDMFNEGLKARVAGVCAELVSLTPQSSFPQSEVGKGKGWWPSDLGTPSMLTGQNEVRCAYFPKKNRLAVSNGGKVTIYDATGYEIQGIAQQQSDSIQQVRFHTKQGLVGLDAFKIVID